MKFIETLEKYFLLIGLSLLPLVFLPIVLSPFEPIKLGFLLFFIGVVIILFSIKTIIKGSVSIFTNNFDFALILLALSYLVSALFITPNKLEAFFNPGTATIILTSTVLFFLLKGYSSEKKTFISALLVSGVVVSIVSLLAMTGTLAKISQLPAFAKIAMFSPFGGKISEVTFLAIIAPLGISLIFSEREIVKKIFWGVSLALISLNLALSIYNILPGKPAAISLPDFTTSWSVAVDTLKVSPFLGIGPGNYLSAFGQFRPISYNATPIWSLKYLFSRSYVFTLITETGLLGLIAIIFLTLQLARVAKSHLTQIKEHPLSLDSGILISMIIAIVLMFILPVNITELAIFALLLAFGVKVRETVFQVPVFATQEKSITTKIPVIIVSLPLILGVIAVYYFSFRSFQAEYKFKKFADALSQNDANKAFTTLTEAININPKVDKYRSNYAQLNLIAAENLTKKKDLSDNDKNTITQLIQAAIAEGKAAVAVNPQRADNWAALASIYQAVMPIAQGADSFAIQTYNQAIALDPINPNLRMSLGGVYYALGRYDDAAKAFELAILAKPDLANTHFNYAIALREKGETQNAIDQLKLVLTLVEKDSNDYNTVKTEIDNLEKKLPVKEAVTTPAGQNESGSLTPPQPAEAPVIKPPLELPEEATPPTQP